MTTLRGAVSSYEQEAKDALAIAIIKEPQRKAEFEKHVKEWIVAYTFYREQGIPEAKIEGQLRGIDFNHPVKVGVIPPPGKFAQYQPPTTDGKFPQAATGNYWAEPGQTPQALGISDFGKMRDPSKPWAAAPDAANVKKTSWKFEADATMPAVPALFSVAAPVVDNWSRRSSWDADATVVPVICEGGGKQIFAPKGKDILKLLPGQKPIQAADAAVAIAEKYTRGPKA